VPPEWHALLKSPDIETVYNKDTWAVALANVVRYGVLCRSLLTLCRSLSTKDTWAVALENVVR
jgi:hypothetical protein